jgi:hypothetical protein
MKMQTYIGTKMVKLGEMNKSEYCEYRGWKLPSNEDGKAKGYLVEYLDKGKPNDERHKGYISWTPEEQANNAYRKTDGLPLGLAIEALKKGYRIARHSWNSKYMYVVLMDGYPDGVIANEETCLKHRLEPNCGSIVRINPYLALYNAQGNISTWAPSVNDALTEDWYIVGF